MSRSQKKPRPKFDARKFEPAAESQKKKEKDWTFEDIVRSKSQRH